MIIKTNFSNEGVPQEGLSPTVRIINLPNLEVEVSGAGMTENTQITGSYFYDFTSYNVTGNYDIRCNGGAGLSNYDRYTWATNSDDLEIGTGLDGVSGAVAANKVDLDNPSQYMAIITGVALDGEYDSVISGIQAEVDKPTNFMANVTGINDLSGFIAPMVVDLDNPSQYMSNVTGINDLSGYIAPMVVDLNTPNQYKADVSSVSTHTPANVWSQGGRSLTTPSDYRANITGLATSGSVAYVGQDVSGIKAVTDNFPTDMSGEIAIVQGLLHSNIYTVPGWTDDDMTTSLIKLYDSKANTVTHGAGGLLATFSMTGVYVGGKAQSILMVRES